jgi:hypothetical protein
VHVVARDGKLVDRFNTGKTLTGLAAAGIDGRSVLLVAGGDGLVAWSVAPK